MNTSRVFFIDFHTGPNENIYGKFNRLLVTAGIDTIDFQKKMTAIKIHFGEYGNLAYIRPNYAHQVVNMIKERGGMPFLTDANTLYKGRRSNAIDHLQTAMENGFNPLSTGCNLIIADGLRGTDYKEIEINLKHCKTAKIASAIANSDIIISMNHFKGHDMAGFGGALKNIGMGSGSIGGKLEMHSDSKPAINADNCVGCGTCVDNCAQEAVTLGDDNIATINYDLCVGCGQCIAVCQYDAAHAQFNSETAQEKMMEYAFAVLHNKPAFHINFIMNVSPNCDCWNYNDIPIVPDIGIAASFDPVALDKACVDLINKTPINPNSIIGKADGKDDNDRFHLVYSNVKWEKGISYAEKIGLGSQNYELIKI
jgi:uncharacterized Fe-S center protein